MHSSFDYMLKATSYAGKLILIGAMFLVIISAGCNEQTPEEVDYYISQSTANQSADKLCQEIPKPPGFSLVERNVSSNSQRALINYYYQAGDKSFVMVKRFYHNWLQANGWSLGLRIDYNNERGKGYFEFHKGKQTVAVERVNFPGIDYSISCLEDKP
jgi:hypothetical protein